MCPCLVLQFGTGEPKRQFIQRIAGTGHDLDLAKRAAVLNVGTKRYPAGFRMPGRRHQSKRLGARVQYHDTCGDRAARCLGVNQYQLVGRDAGGARIKVLLRRFEFGQILLPGRDNLLCRCGAAAQTDPIGFLPQLAETLQRSEEWTPLDVQGPRASRSFRYAETLDWPSPAIRRALRHCRLGWRDTG